MTTCIYKRGLWVFADKRSVGNYIDDNCSKIVTVNDFPDWNEYTVIHSGLMISHDIIKRAIYAYKNRDMGKFPIHEFSETLRPYLLLEENSSTILLIVRWSWEEKVYELICTKTWIQICDCNSDFYSFGSGWAMAKAIYTHSIISKHNHGYHEDYHIEDLFDDIMNIFPTINKLDPYTSELCIYYRFKNVPSQLTDLSDIPF